MLVAGAVVVLYNNDSHTQRHYREHSHQIRWFALLLVLHSYITYFIRPGYVHVQYMYVYMYVYGGHVQSVDGHCKYLSAWLFIPTK